MASKTLDASAVRSRHTQLLLRLLWQDGRLSRAELARRSGLSRSTVTAIANTLLNTDLVRELGAGRSNGGRRPIVLGFNYQARLAIGVDLSASHVAVALVTLKGEVLVWREEAHPVRQDPEGTIALSGRLIQELLDEEPGAHARVLGIGVGAPSPIFSEQPHAMAVGLMPMWVGHDIVASLGQRFQRPVLLDNDANLGALGELRWGAARGRKHVALLTLGTGLGLGLVIDGQIYRGARGSAGEISHLSIDINGPQCVCGQRGCLVLLAGSAAVTERANALARARGRAGDGEDLWTTAELVAAARGGDPLAREIFADVGRWLGVALTNVVNLVSPDLVVLGGQLSQAGRSLIDPIAETVDTCTQWMRMSPTEIVTTHLHERDVALGAATLVFDRALSDEHSLLDEAKPLANAS